MKINDKMDVLKQETLERAKRVDICKTVMVIWLQVSFDKVQKR